MTKYGIGVLWFLCCWGMVGCLPAQNPPQPLVVTATPEQFNANQLAENLPPLSVAHRAENTNPTQANPPINPTRTAAPTQISSCPMDASANRRPQYTINAILDWDDHTVSATQQVSYLNTTGVPLEQLVFQVEPNRQTGFFSLGTLKVNDQTIDNAEISVTRLTIPLPEPLGSGCQTAIEMDFELRIPPVEPGYYGRFGYLGYTSRQTNLSQWLPKLALHQEGDWYIPQPYFVGEQTITEASDFSLTFQVIDAPPTIAVAGPGHVQVTEDSTWIFDLEGGRDISVSVGNGFRRSSELADNGIVIELYYFPESNINGLNAPKHAAEAAADALILYEELFGVRYPYARLVIVEGDFPDGMEFSGLVYVSEAWFRTWPGQATSWLTIITVHEVAHQWWYLLVGNDPAAYPYLDEAFATYSEYLYYQRYFGEETDWWWDFRVRGHDIENTLVDADIYAYQDARSYINGSYLRGAEMLHNIRLNLGDEGFFNWLRSYVDQNMLEIATPIEFWGTLADEDFQNSEDLRQQYLGKWQIFPTPTPLPSDTPTPTQSPTDTPTQSPTETPNPTSSP